MKKRITVFTPTFNRRHTLNRLYLSLSQQDCDLFEWLVIDDGSTDGTDDLINNLKIDSKFEIRYYWQKNGGKHRAHNKALNLALGKYIAIVDSDDELVPGAISRISDVWFGIEQSDFESIAGLSSNTIDENGMLHGVHFPEDVIDGYLFDLVFSGLLVGEKLPCYRLDVLRNYPFPEFENNTDLVPEETVWLAIGKQYKTRCVNQSFRIYHRDENDSNALSKVYGTRVTLGLIESNIVILNYIPKYIFKHLGVFIKAAVKISIYSLKCDCGLFYAYKKFNGFAKLFYLAMLPVSLAFVAVNFWRIQSRSATRFRDS